MSYDKIKQSALKHFARSGYEGASLSQIAADAGIKKPSIYNHFVGKEDLYLAVLEGISSEYEQFLQSSLQHQQGQAPESQLYGMYRAYIEYFTNDGDRTEFWKRTIMFPPPVLQERITSIVGRIEQQFAPQLALLFTQGIDKGDIQPYAAEELVTLFYCLVNGYMMGIMMAGPHEFTQKLERIWTMFWQGVGKGQWVRVGGRNE
ncbi:MAG: transcriptional regulator, TetR family [Paenibacillus sp.]|jgi:AcrR family transcriptional regulator|nr:transcriptional regulator, TetR family [Paenibacillus sp.]